MQVGHESLTTPACRDSMPDSDRTSVSGQPLLPILDALLLEQHTLSAVDQFTSDLNEQDVPAQAKYYSRLLPANPPGPGEQYAFEVDLDRCSGCKACVTACHAMNGLDEDEAWRDTGLLVGGSPADPVLQHVTTACHHCVEPACLTACPVNAYKKDAATGIVRHLDDQCFGCQYCTLACPYDVPKYSPTRGIVRKCDLCSDRLAASEAPACVQACPHEAISIRTVDVQHIRESAEADPFLPGAPDPSATLPTTHFRTTRVFPRNLLPADYHAINPQQPHWPLIVMLVLTQLSVGAFAVGLWLEQRLAGTWTEHARPVQAVLGLAFGVLALAASTLHLGRPQYAFRAVLGLRHSWLSREILAFGIFAVSAGVYALLVWLHPDTGLCRVAGWITVSTGAVAVSCSAMIYAFTRREFWAAGPTLARFALSCVILGIGSAWLSILLVGVVFGSDLPQQLSAAVARPMLRTLMLAVAAKLLLELSVFRALTSFRTTPLKRSALLLIGPLAGSTLARFALGVLGGFFIPLLLIHRLASAAPVEAPALMVLVAGTLVASAAGETIERYQFFAAVAAPRMPGGIRP